MQGGHIFRARPWPQTPHSTELWPAGRGTRASPWRCGPVGSRRPTVQFTRSVPRAASRRAGPQPSSSWLPGSCKSCHLHREAKWRLVKVEVSKHSLARPAAQAQPRASGMPACTDRGQTACRMVGCSRASLSEVWGTGAVGKVAGLVQDGPAAT